MNSLIPKVRNDYSNIYPIPDVIFVKISVEFENGWKNPKGARTDVGGSVGPYSPNESGKIHSGRPYVSESRPIVERLK